MTTFKDELRRVAAEIYDIAERATNIDQVHIAIVGYMNTLVDAYLKDHNPDYHSLLEQAKKYNEEGKILHRTVVAERQKYWQERQEVLSQIDSLAEEKAKEKVKDLLTAFIDGTYETW